MANDWSWRERRQLFHGRQPLKSQTRWLRLRHHPPIVTVSKLRGLPLQTRVVGGSVPIRSQGSFLDMGHMSCEPMVWRNHSG